MLSLEEVTDLLRGLSQQWREMATAASTLAAQYDLAGGDDAGNAHAFRKEARVRREQVDELDAEIALLADVPPPQLSGLDELEDGLVGIFERPDIYEAFAGHCAHTHLNDEDVRYCKYCGRLRAFLANAIIEWCARRGYRLPAHPPQELT